MVNNGDLARYQSFPLPPIVAVPIIEAIRSYTRDTPGAAFSDHPVRTIWPPEASFPASMHTMDFEPGFNQRFHKYECGRHIITFADVGCYFEFSLEQDPENIQKIMLPPFNMNIIRFGPKVWHRFIIPEATGLGVVALSFHEADNIITDDKDIMTMLSTFLD